MFGYIKPFKPQLRVCEYDTYKAIYCGLCKQLSRSYGPFARLTLSYDFTLLALLDLALREGKPEFKNESCLYNPLKKKPCCCDCQSLQFSASAAILMLYYKVLDNIEDERYPKKILYYCLLPLARRAHRRASGQFQDLDRFIRAQMKIQANLEHNKCDSVDAASEPTARCLSQIMEMLSNQDNQKRVLGRLGYLLGRWVYMADALDDLEEDRKKGSYNPFLIQAKAHEERLEELRQEAVLSLNLTMGEIIKTFDLLECKRYKEILSNIFELGLMVSVHQLQTKEPHEKKKYSFPENGHLS